MCVCTAKLEWKNGACFCCYCGAERKTQNAGHGKMKITTTKSRNEGKSVLLRMVIRFIFIHFVYFYHVVFLVEPRWSFRRYLRGTAIFKFVFFFIRVRTCVSEYISRTSASAWTIWCVRCVRVCADPRHLCPHPSFFISQLFDFCFDSEKYTIWRSPTG